MTPTMDVIKEPILEETLDFKKKSKSFLENTHKNIDRALFDLQKKSLMPDSLILRIGDKVYKLVATQTAQSDIAQEIISEITEKATQCFDNFRNEIYSKLQQISDFMNTSGAEIEKIERKYKDKISRMDLMPSITKDHVLRGLSVCKTNESGVLMWVLPFLYRPRTIDRVVISEKIRDEITRKARIVVITKGEFISSVYTTKEHNWDYLPHYHQASPDCWGKFKPSGHWKSGSDILSIMESAMGVLENINGNSIAKKEPAGLPSWDKLQTMVIKEMRDNEKLKDKAKKSEAINIKDAPLNVTVGPTWDTSITWEAGPDISDMRDRDGFIP